MKELNNDQQNKVSLEDNDHRTERFVGSVVLLISAILAITLFIVFYYASLSDLSGIWALFTGIGLMFYGFIIFVIALILSSIGFYLGLSSIKHLPTKAMTVWARIVSYANLVISIGTLILVLYFLQIFF